MPRKNPPPRTLTPEEEQQWQEEAGLVQPIKTKQRQVAPPPRPGEKAPHDSPLRADRPRVKMPQGPLRRGTYEGIDKNTRERFRKGAYPIDATLDLHGLTRDVAYRRVEDFIHQHYLLGHRCLLIVTGKGALHTDPTGSRTGVLKELLPTWLADDALRPYILAFDKAAAKHGGSGAAYVLLRRAR